MNPSHVPVNTMLRLKASIPPVFKAGHAALDVVGEVDRPDDGGAVVAGGDDGGGGRAVSQAQNYSIATLHVTKHNQLDVTSHQTTLR